MSRRTRHSMTTLAAAIFVVLASLFFGGCSESRAANTFYPIPDQRTTAFVTTTSVVVIVPTTLVEQQVDPGLVDRILRKVTDERTEKPIHGTDHYYGAPAGWTVKVHVGPMAYSGSPTGVIVGAMDKECQLIHVAYKAPHTGTHWELPALGHEYSHAYAWLHGDQNWRCIGHGNGCVP